MKIKHIAAVAAAMVAGAAFAQSNVSLYGVIDAGIRFDNNADGKGRNATYLNNGTLSNSRIGFKGKEDLGGGLKAGFQIEAGFALHNGRQDGIRTGANNSITDSRIFNRISKAGLESEYGSLYFGRQYTLVYDIVSMYEPTDWYNDETHKTGGAIDPSGQIVPYRSDNTAYYAGTFGPVTLRASYVFGGVPGSMQSGSSWAGGLSYDDNIMGGALKLGTAFNRSVSNGIQGGTTTITAFPSDGATTYNTDIVTVGGSYAYGPIKGMLGYIYKKTDGKMLASGGIGAYNQNTIFGGLTYSVTPAIDLTLAYYRHKFNANGTIGDGYNLATNTATANVDGKADVVIFIADYKLSKRTDIYATYDYTRTGTADGLQSMYMPFTLANDASTTTNVKNSRSGYTIGLRHRF